MTLSYITDVAVPEANARIDSVFSQKETAIKSDIQSKMDSVRSQPVSYTHLDVYKRQVQALFIPAGCLGAQAQLPGGHPDGGALEGGRFKDNHLGVFGDLTVETTHDTGYAHRLCGIGDQQHAFVQLPLHAVQSGGLFSGMGPADDDGVLSDAPVVDVYKRQLCEMMRIRVQKDLRPSWRAVQGK